MSLNQLELLQQKAKANPQKVAFPEASEEKILLAARRVRDLGLGYPTLVGESTAITALAQSIGISLEGIILVDNTDISKVEQVVAEYVKLNQSFPASALKRMARDPMYFSLMLEATGEVDCMVCGIAHTTGEVILASETIIGLKEGISTVSSVGLHTIRGYEGPDGSVLAFADCAVNPAPDPGQLADIAIATADTTRIIMGWEPRVALLSFSTKGSATHERVDAVLEALRLVLERRPDILIDGELQLDSALIPDVAAKKLEWDSPVAGKANILIFPNLDAGNIGVKIFATFASGGPAAGPLLQGFAKPVCDLSRGVPLMNIVGAATAVIVLAQAQKKSGSDGRRGAKGA
jgi:phosphate acetyltransferase